MKTLLRMCAGFTIAILGQACAEEVAIIVNKANPVDNLTIAQVRKMVLGEQGQWPNGKQVMVLLRTPGAVERLAALQVICGMTEPEFNQYFLHASFNGANAAVPKSLGSAALLRQLVTSVPGAIGFVAVSDVNDSVKVVKLEGQSPGEADYKLNKK